MLLDWKNYSESFKRSFLVIFMYGFAFGLGNIARLIGTPDIYIVFYVSEQERFATYSLNLKDLLDLILVGPIFSIFSFILIKRILDDLKEQEIAEKKIMLYYFCYLIALVIFNYGHFIHVTMNRLNAQIVENDRTENFYYTVYFLDEFIGHLFIAIGFFIILTEVCFLHSLNTQKIEAEKNSDFFMTSYEKKWNCFFGIALGLATALAYLEGQCTFVFLILNPIFCVLLLVYNKKKTNTGIKNNSILTMFILMTIAFVITALIWGLVTGFKPVYPYFYQNSEL